MLSLVGVPGIYFHSLFGSRGWSEGVKETGRNRTINRQKCDRAKLEEEINNPVSLRSRVFKRYTQLLKLRAASAAFHPHGSQQILDCGDSSFAILRISPDGSERVLCLHNVSPQTNTVTLNLEIAHDLINDSKFNNHFTLSPYQIVWLKLYDSH